MRFDFNNLWLVYRDNTTGRETKFPALDWIGQPGPINEEGEQLELIGYEVEE